MFDVTNEQPRAHCQKCKKLFLDDGLFTVWQAKNKKGQIKKNKYCRECFHKETEELFK